MSDSDTVREPLQIVYRPLRDLAPYARNARRHSAKQLDKLRASLGRYGWTNPMLIAGQSMIAGHGRLAAALSLAADGKTIPGNPDPWSGPTVDLSYLTAEEQNAYRLADNRIALDAGWDVDLLKLEMADLSNMGNGLDLLLTGFGKVEINTLLGTARVKANSLASTNLSYQIIVECTDEAHQAAVLTELKERGHKCRPLIL